MTASDLLRTGSLGLRTRRTRATLSALGVAIGIASMVAVLGISESSRADLIAQLDQLGTNLLRVAPGQSFRGEDAELPESAAAMIRRVTGVQATASTKVIADATVRRTDLIDEAETGGIAVSAAEPSLLSTLGAELARGAFLTRANERYPVVVLGADAAERLGVRRTGVRVWLGERWFQVVGILEPFALAPALDSRGADRLPGRRGAARRRRVRLHDLRARRAGRHRRRARAARPHGEPGAARGGRRLAPLRRARGARGSQDRVHLAVPRARRRRPARGRRGDRQRDGDLGARAALGGRPAARARRDAPQRRRPVPHRVAAAGHRRRAGRRGARRGGHGRLRGRPGLAGRRARGRARRRRGRRRRHRGRGRALSRRCAPPASRRRRRSGVSSRHPRRGCRRRPSARPRSPPSGRRGAWRRPRRCAARRAGRRSRRCARSACCG